MWDKISQMFLIGSLSGIAVLGDVIREYLPVNLILTFGFINVGIMLLKMYFQKKFEEKSLYADNHYDQENTKADNHSSKNCVLSALRLCVWRFNSSHMELCNVDQAFAFALRTKEWESFLIDSIFSDFVTCFISADKATHPLDTYFQTV